MKDAAPEILSTNLQTPLSSILANCLGRARSMMPRLDLRAATPKDASSDAAVMLYWREDCESVLSWK